MVPIRTRRLDLSVPAAKRFPTALFVHGGSLTSGDKADSTRVRPFPDANIACANVNYRLAPAHAWPAHAEDVAAAVGLGANEYRTARWRSAQVVPRWAQFGSDLVALVSTDERYLARHGLKISALRGVVPMGSIMWDDDLEQAPPVLKTHRKFVEDARALANWADYKVLPGRTHYSAIRQISEPGDLVFAIVRDFVRQFSGAGTP